MKALIVYASVHQGNTEKLGKAMAAAVNADIVEAKSVNRETLSHYDVIGFGSGIYNGNLHKSVLHVIETLPKAVHGKKAFVFSTNSFGIRMLNNKAVNALRERGLAVIGSFTCRGYFDFKPARVFGGISKGRPNEADLQRARDFVQHLLAAR